MSDGASLQSIFSVVHEFQELMNLMYVLAFFSLNSFELFKTHHMNKCHAKLLKKDVKMLCRLHPCLKKNQLKNLNDILLPTY